MFHSSSIFLKTLVVALMVSIPHGEAYGVLSNCNPRKMALICAVVAGASYVGLQFLHSRAFILLKAWIGTGGSWAGNKQRSKMKGLLTLRITDDLEESPLPDTPEEFYLNNRVAEVLQSEAAFTTAADPKPVIATYGCGPCVALAGWESQNKIGFLVHLSNAGEVDYFKRSFSRYFGKLLTQQHGLIQVHIRGGWKGASEKIIDLIEKWAEEKETNFPLVISSSLTDGFASNGKSIALDVRDGQIYSYDPKLNPYARQITENVVVGTLLSVKNPTVATVYVGKASPGTLCKKSLEKF